MKLEAKSAYNVETTMQMPKNEVHAVDDEDFERLSEQYGCKNPISFTLYDTEDSAPRHVIARKSLLEKNKKEFFEFLTVEMFHWAFKTAMAKKGFTPEEYMEELDRLAKEDPERRTCNLQCAATEISTES